MAEYFTKAIQANSSNALAYSNRCHAYNKLKKYEDALEDCNKAIELYPSSSDVFNHRGNVFKNLKRLDEAKQDFDKAIALNPRHEHAYYNRGVLLSDFGNYAEAINDFKKDIELESTNKKKSFYMLARSYYLQGEYDQALAAVKRTLEVDPGKTDARYTRALCYFSINDF